MTPWINSFKVEQFVLMKDMTEIFSMQINPSIFQIQRYADIL